MFCLLEIRRQQQSLKMDMVWWLEICQSVLSDNYKKDITLKNVKSWPFFCPFCPYAVNPLQSATFQDSLYCFNKAPAVVTHHNGVPVRPRYLISDAAHSSPLFTKGITMSSGGHYAGMAPVSNALHIQQSLFTNGVNPLEIKQQPAPQGKQGLSSQAHWVHKKGVFLKY